MQDRPRSSRSATYTAEQRAEVIAAALTKPDELGSPFGAWTLDRLQAYLQEHKGIAIKRSRIDEILLDEGLRWRKQESLALKGRRFESWGQTCEAVERAMAYWNRHSHPFV